MTQTISHDPTPQRRTSWRYVVSRRRARRYGSSVTGKSQAQAEADLLRGAFEKSGLSPYQLARDAKVSPGTVRNALRGWRPGPDNQPHETQVGDAAFAAIATVLQIPPKRVDALGRRAAAVLMDDGQRRAMALADFTLEELLAEVMRRTSTSAAGPQS